MIALKVKELMDTQTETGYRLATVELINEFVEKSFCKEDIYEFIETYGEDVLESCYEDYVKLGEEYSYQAVDAFCSEFGVENIGNFQDAYYGEYETPEIFVENYVNETEVSVPDYLVVDWEATWKCNFQYDFSFVDGFIFNKF